MSTKNFITKNWVIFAVFSLGLLLAGIALYPRLSSSPLVFAQTANVTTAYLISATGVNGFNSPVSLSASGLPSGVSASFSPSSISPGQSSLLTLTVSKSVLNSTYTFTVTGTGGSLTHNLQANLVVNFAPPPVVAADIKANGSDGPVTIPYNTGATIGWTSSNANSCSVSPDGWTGTSGNQPTGQLISSRTYSLSCSGTSGSASDSVVVNVTALPISCGFVANPTVIVPPGRSTLSWNCENAQSCFINQGVGAVNNPASSSATVNPTSTTTYTLTCSASGVPNYSASTRVTVVGPGIIETNP